MKRIMFCTSLVMLMQGNTFAEKSEVFPFSDIAVGMSSKELLEKHPTEEILASKKTGDQILERGVVMYNIPENKFWDSLGVHVSNAKVQSLTYCNVNKKLLLARDTDAFDFSSVVKNVSPLFKELKQQLGSTFEKKVTSRSVRETKIRGPMYVWKREKDFVAFIHTPISQYKKGDLFNCQVTIAPTFEDLASLCKMATDSVPEDAKLWADAMDE